MVMMTPTVGAVTMFILKALMMLVLASRVRVRESRIRVIILVLISEHVFHVQSSLVRSISVIGRVVGPLVILGGGGG